MLNRKDDIKRMYLLFADIFDYPTPNLLNRIRQSATLFSIPSEGSGSIQSAFSAFARTNSLGRLEETYTRTFDLQPSCYPYIGYHLFGESYKRGDFLVKLKERYAKCEFSTGNELPDHLAVILRYLSTLEDEEERRDLINLCLLPSLRKMSEALANDKNPYRKAMQGLILALQAEVASQDLVLKKR